MSSSPRPARAAWSRSPTASSALAAEPRAELAGVLETALYYDGADRDEVQRFYRDLLGLPLVGEWDDGTALRLGQGVLLLFDRDRLTERDEPIAAHGTTGPGHACLLAASGAYESWKSRLDGEGVELTHEQSWRDDLRSCYFSDPAGNLLEIAEADIWPRGE